MDRYRSSAHAVFGLSVLDSKCSVLLSYVDEAGREIGWPAMYETIGSWIRGKMTLVRLARALQRGRRRADYRIGCITPELGGSVLPIISRHYYSGNRPALT